MAVVHGEPGEWARVKGTVRGLWPVMAASCTCGFAAAMWIFASANWGVALMILSLLAFYFCTWRGMRRIHSFYVGAKGEERVSGILSELPPQYHVFNDFVACGRHVDHVVAGPAGVYAIETKNWRGRVSLEEGTILVDGRAPSRPPLKQVVHEAGMVAKTLAKAGWKGDVVPVLTFASDTFSVHVAEHSGVVIMNACELKKCFATDRVALLPRELDRLVNLMENVL